MADWTAPATVLRVLAVNQIQVSLDLGWWTFRITTVYVDDLDAPPAITDAGKAATDLAAGLLPPGEQVVVRSRGFNGTDTFGSIALPDGADYADTVLAAGHAQPYPA
jgi:hypothetical protein